MKRKTLIGAALAAGSLLGLAGVAQATPAVVAGTMGPYPYTAPYPYSAPYYPAPGVTVYPSQPNTVVVPDQPAVAYSQTIVQSAPPAPLYEPVPAARAGYVWAPGHYELRNGQYAWIGGEWMTARPGFAWRAGHWEQNSDGSWAFMSGHWIRGDGYAYNNGRWGPYGDRDGDGVINRDDRYPNDPTRW
jgi:hypothetical protein